jgi:acyl-[acyl-carrier-protein]-phospholipid O-acyltransferase / long-chain-fatty-acid--[acyl-carrier-protein] ligase
MISLAAVEMLAAELWPDTVSAAATAPDTRKGERLILFTQNPAAKRSDFQVYAKSKGASELMIPSDVLVLDRIPVLGSGKVDHAAIAKLVQQRFTLQSAAVA